MALSCIMHETLWLLLVAAKLLIVEIKLGMFFMNEMRKETCLKTVGVFLCFLLVRFLSYFVFLCRCIRSDSSQFASKVLSMKGINKDFRRLKGFLALTDEKVERSA